MTLSERMSSSGSIRSIIRSSKHPSCFSHNTSPPSINNIDKNKAMKVFKTKDYHREEDKDQKFKSNETMKRCSDGKTQQAKATNEYSTNDDESNIHDSTCCDSLTQLCTLSAFTNHCDVNRNFTENTSREVYQGYAWDIILIQSTLDLVSEKSDTTLLSSSSLDTTSTNAAALSCNDIYVTFGGRTGVVQVYIDDQYIQGLDMIAHTKGPSTFQSPFSLQSPQQPTMEGLRQLWGHIQSLSETSKAAVSPITISFRLYDLSIGRHKATAEASLFLWNLYDPIFVWDIDGTITQSNIRGVWDTLVTHRYHHIHPGIATFLQNLTEPSSSSSTPCDNTQCLPFDNQATTTASHTLNNTKEKRKTSPSRQQQPRIVYLTSRPISLIQTTRKFLKNFQQSLTPLEMKNNFPRDDVRKTRDAINTNKLQGTSSLPSGPLICNPKSLADVLASELLWKDIYQDKYNLLMGQIITPFRKLQMSTRSSNRDQFHHEEQQHLQLPTTTQRISSDVSNTDRKNNSFCPLVLGFGNTITDTMAYESVGIPLSCIYQIDSRGIITSHEDPITTRSYAYSKRDTSSSSMKRFLGQSYHHHDNCHQYQQQIQNLKSSTFEGYLDPKLWQDIQLKLGLHH